MPLPQTMLVSEMPQSLLPCLSYLPGPGTTLSLKLSLLSTEHQDDLLTIEGTQSALRVHQLPDSRAQYEREPWSDNKGTYQNRSGLK